MKYGIIIYKKTDNLGDDILSYAAARLLPQTDFCIDREELDLFCPDEKEKVAVIMNGWYLYHKYNWPPSPYIHPLLIGMHLAQKDYLGIGYDYIQGIGKDFFVKSEPVGCRDTSTKEALDEKGIDAYISGCLTLTLDRFSDCIKTNKIYLVDVPEEIERKIKEENNNNIEMITHNLNIEERDMYWKDRALRVEKFLKMYQGASCVVTSRLHVALPCLSLATPVLLICNEEDNDRFSDYLPFLHYCTKEEFLNGIVQYDINHPLPNKDTFLDVRMRLLETCRQFVYSSLHNEMGLEELPEPLYFRKYWFDKATWQKQLLMEKRDLLELDLIQERQWSRKQNEVIRWLKEQAMMKDAKIEELEENNLGLQDWLKDRNVAIDYLAKEFDSHNEFICSLNKQVSKLEDKIIEITSSRIIRLLLKIKTKTKTKTETETETETGR